MTKNKNNPVRIKPNTKLGELAAETDNTLLDSCFVDGGYLEPLSDVNSASSIILGRTGSGKSALIYKLCQTTEKHKKIDPLDVSIHFLENSGLINFFTELGVKLSIFYRFLWKHILIVELIKLRYDIKNEEKRESIFSELRDCFKKDDCKKKAIDYVDNWKDIFWETTEVYLKEITNKLETETKAAIGTNFKLGKLSAEAAKNLTEEEKLQIKQRSSEIVNKLQISQLKEMLELLQKHAFTDTQKHYYIFIDNLDDEWAETSIRYQFIKALIEEIKSFRVLQNVKIVIALRTDLLLSVIDETRGAGFQEEKYEAYFANIEWTEELLEELIKKRLKEVYERQYTKDDVGISDVFPSPKNSSKSGSGGMTPVKYIIQRTFFRPRDVLQFVNEAFKVSRDRERISWDSMKKAEGSYSLLRLKSLTEEWGDIYPSLSVTFDTLRNLRSPFTRGDITDLTLDEVINSLAVEESHDPCVLRAKGAFENKNTKADVLNEILLCLYTVGAIGCSDGSKGKPFYWSFKSKERLTKNYFKKVSNIKIHKMLHRALDTPNNADDIYEEETYED